MTKTCIACEHFAGRERDKTAELFKSNRGYCDHPKHFGGIWNVVQNITKPQKYELFKQAADDVVLMREKAVAHFEAKRRKNAKQ